MNSWFPIPESLAYGNPTWRGLTTNAKILLLACISEANRQQGEFFRTNDEFRVRLGGPDNPIALHTLLSARNAISEWVNIEPGTRAGLQSKATTYMVADPLWNPADIEGHWAQMPRYAFEDLLWRLGRNAALAYVYLSVEFWRYRARYAEKKCFTIDLGEMKTESGLRDFYPLVQKLYRDFQYKNGDHLFEFKGWRRIEFSDWSPAPEDVNAEIAEKREKDIQMRTEKLTSDRSYMAGVGR